MQILFIGFGLIGGSLAKNIHENHPEYALFAYSRHEEKLLPAVEDGVLTGTLSELDERVFQMDLIILCTPVNFHPMYLEKLKPLISSTCLITDVGSTKESIHKAVESLGLSSQFIGGHPMAGSEKTGYEHAVSHLFENAYYFLTPGEGTTEKQLSLLVTIAREAKAIPLVLPYEKHDRCVAAVSHLPHLVACALVDQVRTTDDEEELMRHVAAGGFKDITRIASSSPEMWEQICLSNRSAVADALSWHIARMQRILTAVEKEEGQEIFDLFETAGDYRKTLSDKKKGPFSPQYVLHCDIVDRPGSIAQVAVILSASGISMKNIGIIHSREYEGGVLRVEFYEEEAKEKAREIFQKNGIALA